jgi:hypothetical protein
MLAYIEIGVFGRQEKQSKSGLTGGCAHYVITTTFAKFWGRYSP